MLHPYSVAKPSLPIAFLRVAIFLSMFAFLAESMYCVITDGVLREFAQWQRFGVAIVVLGLLDAIIGDYANGAYGTVPGSLPYYCFLLLSAIVVGARTLDSELAILALVPPTLILGCVILVRGFDLFER